MSQKKEEPKRLCIIGGGLSLLILLDQLKTGVELNPTLAPMEIEVFEATDEFIGGPWSRKGNRSFHTLNTYANEEVIQGLKEASKLYPNVLPGKLSDHIYAHGELSRIADGTMNKKALDIVCNELNKRGVAVKLHANTRVTELKKYDDFYLIRAEGQKLRKSDFVVIAPGHWTEKSGTNDNPGVFSSPWPAERLENIQTEQSIAILGSSLSAVDGALTLSHKAGEFISQPGGGYTFKPHSDKFKLVTYSPHTLPLSVLGQDGTYDQKENDVLKDALANNTMDPDGFVSLDKVFEVLKKDFLRRYGSSPALSNDLKTFLENDHLTLDMALEQLHKNVGSQNPIEYMRQQVASAKESRTRQNPTTWQTYLRETAHVIEIAYQHMSGEDQDRFMSEFRPVFVKLAYGMVIENAEKILALMEAGCLEHRAMGKHSSFGLKQVEGSDEKLPGGEVHYTDNAGVAHDDYYPAVVKARGDDLSRFRYSSPLVEDLFENGLAHEMLAPYKDQAKAKEIFEQGRIAGEENNVRFINGVYYRSGGGLNVNLDSFELTDPLTPDVHSNLFSMGPPVTGQLPLLHGIHAMGVAARGTVNTMITRIITEKEIEPPKNVAESPKDELEGLYVAFEDPTTKFICMVTTEDLLETSPALARLKAAVAKRAGVEESRIYVLPLERLPESIRQDIESQRQQQMR